MFQSRSAPLLRCGTAPAGRWIGNDEILEWPLSASSTQFCNTEAEWSNASWDTLKSSANPFGKTEVSSLSCTQKGALPLLASTCPPRLDRRRKHGGTTGTRPGTSPVSFLIGVSHSATVLNANPSDLSGRAEKQPNLGHMRNSVLSPVDLIKQELASGLDSISGRIDVLRAMHHDFSGERGLQSPTGRRSSQFHAKLAEATDEERRERMLLYKMVRKIEPELPPLQPIPSEEGTELPIRDQSIVRKNCSKEMLASCSKTARLDGLAKRSKERIERGKEAANLRQNSLEKCAQLWADDLLKKQQQGIRAMMLRKPDRCPTQKPLDFSAQWLVHLVVFGFVGFLKEEMSFFGSSSEDESEEAGLPGTGSEAQKSTSFGIARGQAGKRDVKTKFKSASRLLMQSCRFGSPACSKGNGDNLTALSDMVKAQRKVQDFREDVQRITRCLISWRLAGRIFVNCKRMYSNIIGLQRAWKSWMRWNREVISRLSRRWERVERADITREYHREAVGADLGTNNLAMASFASSGRMSSKENKKCSILSICERPHARGSVLDEHRKSTRSSQMPLLTLDEKLTLEMVSVEVRAEFMKRELRARRYLLLPKIWIWEEEVRDWTRENEELRIERDALRTVLDGDETHIEVKGPFRWPPARPSYVPSERYSSGDAEILEWSRAARKHKGEGWTKIETRQPCSKRNASRVADGSASRQRSRRSKDPCEAPSLFGAATDEELEGWGCGFASMPGLQGGSDFADTPRVQPF